MDAIFEDKLDYFFPKFLSKIDKDSDEYKALFTGIDFIMKKDLTLAKLNQLLHLCSRSGISNGYYKYYFFTNPDTHPYPVDSIETNLDFGEIIKRDRITDIDQLEWGLKRIMYDALLYFGNFLKAFNRLHNKSFEDIKIFLKKNKLILNIC